MLFRKKPAEERSPQELEIALQEAEMPQKGLKPFLHKPHPAHRQRHLFYQRTSLVKQMSLPVSRMRR